MNGTERRLMLIDAAVKVCQRDGWSKLSFRRVAEQAACSIKLVMHYFTAAELRDAVIAVAIDKRDTKLIAGAYSDNHPIAKRAVANDPRLLVT